MSNAPSLAAFRTIYLRTACFCAVLNMRRLSVLGISGVWPSFGLVLEIRILLIPILRAVVLA